MINREMQICQNLEKVKENMALSAKRVGRSPEEITLVAVSKTYPHEDMLFAEKAGQKVFGENRVQEMCEKKPYMEEGTEIHLIGHLQTNKVKQAVKNATLIHSVDSYRLAEEISKISVKEGVETKILLQVNVAKDEAKFGIDEENLEEHIKNIMLLPNIKIKGLMTVPAIETDGEITRGYFRKLKTLFDKYKSLCSMDTLSMGMSSDYEIAIEEGATMVRVGSEIFGARKYNV